MRPISFLAGIALALCSQMAHAQEHASAQRSGERIYKSYCLGCHTTKAHWREKRLATDWASLKFQVRRWVNNIGVELSEGEVDALTRYLSRRYYRFATPIADHQAPEPPGVDVDEARVSVIRRVVPGPTPVEFRIPAPD